MKSAKLMASGESQSDSDNQSEDNSEDDKLMMKLVLSSKETHKYKSQALNFFTKENVNSIVCTLRNKHLAYHNGTSSILQHLNQKHPVFNVVKRPNG